MDAVLIAARVVHFASAIALAGSLAFLLAVAAPAFRQAGIESSPEAANLRRRLHRIAWLGLGIGVLSGALWLVLQAGSMSGKPLDAVFAQGIIGIVLLRTRFGQVWLLRLAVAAVLALCLLAGRRRRRGGASVLADWAALVLSAVILATLPWAGHAGATEGWQGDVHVIADALHLLAAGAWLGALVPLALLFAAARRAADAPWAAAARAATLRFSRLGIASVGTLLLTGIVNTWFLAGTIPALLGTGYGQLLLFKVALFLAMVGVAAINRQRLTPQLAAGRDGGGQAAAWSAVGRLRRNALVEAGLGLGILAIVGVLGTTPPGLHVQPWWPFPYRPSLETVAAVPALRDEAIATAALALVGLILMGRGLLGRRRWLSVSVGAALFLGFGWRPVQLLAVEAYPTSYDRSPVRFTAATVVKGAQVYAANCTACHGADGRGDGPLAKALPVRPADLTAPHIFEHADGDLFWWIGHGLADGAMPAFADVLTARQRWQVIAFIHARAAGVQAGSLGAAVTASPAPVAPDFAFEDGNGNQATLGALLAKDAVLLVFVTGPDVLPRLAQLVRWRDDLARDGLRVLAVAAAPPDGASLPASVVTAGPEVPEAYALFERRSPPGRGAPAEFLIDRTGHVRARWRPGDHPDWRDLAALRGELERMARLPLAPAAHGGHVHGGHVH